MDSSLSSLTDISSDDGELSGVFYGVRQNVEAKYEPIVNMPQTQRKRTINGHVPPSPALEASPSYRQNVRMETSETKTVKRKFCGSTLKESSTDGLVAPLLPINQNLEKESLTLTPRAPRLQPSQPDSRLTGTELTCQEILLKKSLMTTSHTPNATPVAVFKLKDGVTLQDDGACQLSPATSYHERCPSREQTDLITFEVENTSSDGRSIPIASDIQKARELTAFDLLAPTPLQESTYSRPILIPTVVPPKDITSLSESSFSNIASIASTPQARRSTSPRRNLTPPRRSPRRSPTPTICPQSHQPSTSYSRGDAPSPFKQSNFATLSTNPSSKRTPSPARRACSTKKLANNPKINDNGLMPKYDAALMELGSQIVLQMPDMNLSPSRRMEGLADDDDKATERTRKRARYSPEREPEQRTRRLMSLSPDSANVLSLLAIASSSTETPSRPSSSTATLIGNGTGGAGDSPTEPTMSNVANSPSRRSPIPARLPCSPATRVPLTPAQTFYANPLDNPNRSPARRVLINIASASPTKLRSASAEPTPAAVSFSVGKPRAQSVEAISKPLPFPLISSQDLAPISEERPTKSMLKAGSSKIPRPPSTKPYTKPPPRPPQSLSQTDNVTKTKTSSPVKVARVAGGGITPNDLFSHSVANKKPQSQVRQPARIVVPGMFAKGSASPSKSASVLDAGILCESVKPLSISESPVKSAVESMSVQSQQQCTEQEFSSSPHTKFIADPTSSTSIGAHDAKYINGIEEVFHVEEELSIQPRRTGRTRRQKDQDGFRAVPLSVQNACSSVTDGMSSRRRPQRPQMPPMSGLGMTENALRALTGQNTKLNEQYAAAELDRQLVRRNGKRPESPSSKVKTVLEKRKEMKERERRERAERRGQRHGDSDSLDDFQMSSEPLSGDGHIRGPGELSDYESPVRPDDGKGVKWHHHLVFPTVEQARTQASIEPVKGILSARAKALRLDNHGNLVNLEPTVTGLKPEKVTYIRYVYDDDEIPLTPPPEPVKRTRKKK